MLTHLLLFIPAALAAIFSPGPDILYVLTRSLTQGRRAGFVAALGFASGLPVHTALLATGLSLALRSWPAALHALQYAGAAYLLYLAIRILRDHTAFVPNRDLPLRALRAVYFQSLIMNLLNPKVTLFFLAFLPQFLTPAPPSTALQISLLGLTFALLTILGFTTCALAAGTLGHALQKNPHLAPRLRYLTAAVFLILAVWLLLSTLHPQG